MSFDLAVWEGAAPTDDAAAQVIFERFMAVMEAGQVDLPSDRIKAFVAALLDQWPDLSDDPDGKSPWADEPLIGNAFGTCVYLAIQWSRAEEATATVARIASTHGLVCFDPQSSTVRSASPQLSATAADRGIRRIFRRGTRRP